tara:strand:+ start:45 stop:428 length:384 start_codon:yes stop_codon:yes gene_type:complete
VIKTKLLQFAINNWRELLVIACLCLVTIKMRMDYNALNKAYEISKEETRERIDALQAIHSEEIERREEAIYAYRKALTQIRSDYENSLEQLDNVKKARAKLIEKQFSQDKEALADEIINAYNFEFVE